MYNIKMDKDIFRKINESIKNKNLIIFVGAGFSRNFGVMDWTNLIDRLINIFYEKKLINLYEKHELSSHKFSNKSVATYLRTKCNNEFFKKQILFLLGKKENLKIDVSILKKFLDYYNGLIITTNYDDVIEKMRPSSTLWISNNDFDNKHVYEKVLHSFNNDGETDVVCHIHGFIDDVESIVFTEDQYIFRYTDDKYIDFFRNIFSKKDVLFLGYGLGEPEVLSLFLPFSSSNKNNFRYALNGYFSDEKPKIEVDRAFLKTHSINLIDYNVDNGYNVFFDYISELNNLLYYKSIELSESSDRLKRLIFAKPINYKKIKNFVSRMSDKSFFVDMLKFFGTVSKRIFKKVIIEDMMLTNFETFCFLSDSIDKNICNARFLIKFFDEIENKDYNPFNLRTALLEIFIHNSLQSKKMLFYFKKYFSELSLFDFEAFYKSRNSKLKLKGKKKFLKEIVFNFLYSVDWRFSNNETLISFLKICDSNTIIYFFKNAVEKLNMKKVIYGSVINDASLGSYFLLVDLFMFLPINESKEFYENYKNFKPLTLGKSLTFLAFYNIYDSNQDYYINDLKEFSKDIKNFSDIYCLLKKMQGIRNISDLVKDVTAVIKENCSKNYSNGIEYYIDGLDSIINPSKYNNKYAGYLPFSDFSYGIGTPMDFKDIDSIVKNYLKNAEYKRGKSILVDLHIDDDTKRLYSDDDIASAIATIGKTNNINFISNVSRSFYTDGLDINNKLVTNYILEHNNFGFENLDKKIDFLINQFDGKKEVFIDNLFSKYAVELKNKPIFIRFLVDYLSNYKEKEQNDFYIDIYKFVFECFEDNKIKDDGKLKILANININLKSALCCNLKLYFDSEIIKEHLTLSDLFVNIGENKDDYYFYLWNNFTFNDEIYNFFLKNENYKKILLSNEDKNICYYFLKVCLWESNRLVFSKLTEYFCENCLYLVGDLLENIKIEESKYTLIIKIYEFLGKTFESDDIESVIFYDYINFLSKSQLEVDEQKRLLLTHFIGDGDNFYYAKSLIDLCNINLSSEFIFEFYKKICSKVEPFLLRENLEQILNNVGQSNLNTVIKLGVTNLLNKKASGI